MLESRHHILSRIHLLTIRQLNKGVTNVQAVKVNHRNMLNISVNAACWYEMRNGMARVKNSRIFSVGRSRFIHDCYSLKIELIPIATFLKMPETMLENIIRRAITASVMSRRELPPNLNDVLLCWLENFLENNSNMPMQKLASLLVFVKTYLSTKSYYAAA